MEVHHLKKSVLDLLHLQRQVVCRKLIAVLDLCFPKEEGFVVGTVLQVRERNRVAVSSQQVVRQAEKKNVGSGDSNDLVVLYLKRLEVELVLSLEDEALLARLEQLQDLNSLVREIVNIVWPRHELIKL